MVNLLTVSGKYAAIIIGILILVVLNSGCISFGGFLNVLSLDNSSSNLTELNKTDNNTYSIAGISFTGPDGWYFTAVNDSRDIIILGSPNSSKFLYFNPLFEVQIINNSEISNPNSPYYVTPENASENDPFSNLGPVMPGYVLVGNSSNYSSISIADNPSEQEIVDMMRNDTNIPGTKISNNTLLIDGKTAYRDVYIFNNLWPPVIDQRIEQIVFVKDEKTYLITFEVPNWDYSKEKQNFDTIINSFKVQ